MLTVLTKLDHVEKVKGRRRTSGTRRERGIKRRAKKRSEKRANGTANVAEAVEEKKIPAMFNASSLW